MNYKFFRRAAGLIFGLTVLISACAPQPATDSPAAASTPSPSPAALVPYLTIAEYGFRFQYPAEYQAVIFQNGLCLSPSREYGLPGPCHVQNLGLEVLEDGNLSLEQAADEVAGTDNPGMEIERTSLMVGGEQAIQLDNIAGVDRMRMVLILHESRLYRLTFVPWTENENDSSPLGILYNTVINSFEFLDQGSQETVPSPASSIPTPDLSSMTVSQLSSTSPNGQWRADAVLASLLGDAPKDYARLTLTRLADLYEEWRPYEEWSETGLGDSFLSDLYWSADGRHLYFTHNGNADGCGNPFVTNLRRVNLEDRSVSQIPLTDIGLDIITLSPERDRLAYRIPEGFMIRSLDTNESYTLPYEWREEHDYLVGGYAWSPDGKTLAFTLTQEYCMPDPSEVAGTSIRLIDLETGEARTLTDRDPRFLTVTGWPEAGTLQVYQDGILYLFDIDSSTLTAEPSPTATAVN